MNADIKSKQYACPLCEKTFKTQSKFLKHTRKKCSYKNKLSKKTKLENPHKEPVKKYICGLCDDRFTYKSSKNRHEQNFCKLRKRTPEEWVDQVKYLQTKNKKAEQAIMRYKRKCKQHEEKSKHLSREFTNIKKLLINSQSKSAPSPGFCGFDDDSSSVTLSDSSISSLEFSSNSIELTDSSDNLGMDDWE